MIERKKIIILGPPGAGKGTQAKLLAEEYGLKYISTGELFLKEVFKDTTLGRKIKKYTKEGKLVPDEETNIFIRKKLRTLHTGFILKGYPRTLAQAEALDRIGDIDAVIYITADKEVIVDRIDNRLTCKCGRTYGKDEPPKEKNKCDVCKSLLYKREDDHPDEVATKYDEYFTKTRPLLRHYKDKLIPIDGNKNTNAVFDEICKKLENKFES